MAATKEKKKAKTPRAKPRRATQREFHACWIELSALGKDYAVWKVGDELNVAEIVHGLPVDGEIEYEISTADFLAAVDEMTARKKNRDPADAPYGEGAEFGGIREFTLIKYDQREYAIVAPCGEELELSGAELRLLASAIRELPPTIGP